MITDSLIGRKEELFALRTYMASEKSEFIAVYGRRRVGKTFLVRHAVNDEFAFYVTGMDNVKMPEQLLNFTLELRRASGKQIEVPKNWLLAFEALICYLESLPAGKKVVFIDELPWMDTNKSNFTPALEHFWNAWASRRNDIKLIVCGSATSWMMDHLINNRGGLHNRLTQKVPLNPFTLAEVEEYLMDRGFSYGRHEIAECYMSMGGIPYYLSKMNKGLSLAQNIDELFFVDNAKLEGEQINLYQALFKHSEKHIKVVAALSKKMKGMTRTEILNNTHLTNNGALSKVLRELESCGFIRHYVPFGKNKNDALYQLIDFYTLFYFAFIEQNKYRDEHFWSNSYGSGVHAAWSGYAFEILCLTHISKIKQALGISGVQSLASSWIGKYENQTTQIDLLIDRRDQTINVCEMKFAADEYEITKKEEETLRRRISIFKNATNTKKSLMLTLITTFSLKQNPHSGIVQKVITLDQLF